MATRVSLEVKVDPIFDGELDKLADDRTMLRIHNELAKYCDPYVPFLEGPLSKTITVSPSGVTYNVPYARYQYYGDDFHHSTHKHPLASARWDEAMMRDRGDEFTSSIGNILMERLREIYG